VAGISYRDVHGIADELGVDVQTVRRWIQSGKLRAFKPGKEYRVREADLEEFLAAREVRPKAAASPEQQLSLNGLLEERRLRYLRGWRAFVHRLAHRWEDEPPKTSAEIAPLFEAMTAVVQAGVFEASGVTDAAETENLLLLTVGFERLNDIADKVEKDEEAEERRATLRLIQEKRSA